MDGGNRISSFPDSIGKLTNLTYLGLGYNKLAYLPDAIGNLVSLITLDLTYNRLNCLPNTIGGLGNLRELYVHNNKLAFLPTEIGNLSALVCLDAEENQLSNLPESFVRLASLEELRLSRNQLNFFPDQELPKLENACLCSNQLLSIPEWMWKLEEVVQKGLSFNLLMIKGYQISNVECSFAHMTYVGRRRQYEQSFSHLWESFKSYHPLSQLSEFYKAVACQRPLEDVHQAYQNLNSEMQRRISALVMSHFSYIPNFWYEPCSSYSLSSSEAGRLLKFEALVKDRVLFAQSVRQAVYQKFEQLGAEEKKNVYYHVWDLAGRPQGDLALNERYQKGHSDRCYTKFLGLSEAEKEAVYYQIWDLNDRPTGVPDFGKDRLFIHQELFCRAVENATGRNDPHWGQNHAEDHVLRFIDALERATS